MGGCSQSIKEDDKLITIDSLLMEELPDSALNIIKSIDYTFFDEDKKAYFNLLKTQALYKAYLPIHSDSIINSSISYYEESNNTQKLGWAYFYKACIISEMGKEKEALDILKKAEDIANNSNDKILLHNTYFHIGSINTLYHENLLAIKYLKKASITSKQTRKFNHLMFDYEKLAKVYAEMGEEDSVRYYLNKALAVVDSLPKSQKNDLNRLWLLFGNFYLDKDLHLSKQFYERSLAVKPHESAYAGLALIKLRQKDTISAKNLFEKGAAIDLKEFSKSGEYDPYTWEACVVKIADKISYLGRDIEDAIRLGLIDINSIPKNITEVLGTTNREIVNTIILDVIENSIDKPYIKLSDNVYKAIKDLKKFNYENIYDKANTKEDIKNYTLMFNKLFDKYLDDLNNHNYLSSIYTLFLDQMNEDYKNNNSNERIVIDYIAGMTDDYFLGEYKRNIINN